MRCHLINLDGDRERLRFVAGQLDAAGADWVRLAAVDARAWTEAERDAFRAARAHGSRPCGWSGGQIGALLSHMEAWRAIAAGSEPWGCVFEDDVHLDPAIGQLLEGYGWIPAGHDIVRFETTRQGMRLGRAVAGGVEGRFGLRPVRAGAWGTAGYAIGRELAGFLCHTPARLQAPVDWLLFHAPSTIAARLRVLQLVPAPCVQDQYAPAAAGRLGFASRTEEAKGVARWRRARDGLARVVRPALGKRAVPFSGVP